jgi:hypothetical protein
MTVTIDDAGNYVSRVCTGGTGETGVQVQIAVSDGYESTNATLLVAAGAPRTFKPPVIGTTLVPVPEGSPSLLPLGELAVLLIILAIIGVAIYIAFYGKKDPHIADAIDRGQKGIRQNITRPLSEYLRAVRDSLKGK